MLTRKAHPELFRQKVSPSRFATELSCAVISCNVGNEPEFRFIAFFKETLESRRRVISAQPRNLGCDETGFAAADVETGGP